MEQPIKALYVQNNGQISTIPMEDKIVNLFSSYPASVSHGFIIEFVYSLEQSLPEEDWAPHESCIRDGNLVIPETPVEDSIAAVYHVFNNLDIEIGVGKLPPNVAYVMGHIYNVLCNYFDDDTVESFQIDCDNWYCMGYNQEI